VSRVAVVSGGGSGIGRSTCLRLADQGCRVAVLDLDGEAAELAAFLCSDEAGFITGQVLGVNGGSVI
jgi:2-hydroxycyclohexanecarboxyl-CoA dehydrogenase